MPSLRLCLSLLSLGSVLVAAATPPDGLKISVDFSREIGPLDSNLWSSSGVDQGLKTKAFAQDMQLIGSVPYGGGRWMRPHFLLNLVQVTGIATEQPAYNWTDLDSTLDTISQAGLTPLFELMGNPSKHFTDFLAREQLIEWRRLIRDLATHLEKRYGPAAVRTWLFESWNEPDINNYWKWKNPQEHQNYYDACSEGLKQADPLLRFGGPGIAKSGTIYSPFLQSFLNHCDTGTNYFTGEKGVRLDFISFHYKNRPAAMVDTEVKNINAVLAEHPRFATLPIFNDEADSEVQWNHPYDYRGTPWYAAFIARSVNEHLVRVVDGTSITHGTKLNFRLSNDDGFWGPWGFRSQFAQFGTDDQFAFIKKPSHTVRTALALLGDRRFAAAGTPPSDQVGVIATRRSDGTMAILLYNYSDKTDETGTARISLTVEHLPAVHAKWIHYRIDSDHGDTHGQWVAMGSPMTPTDEQLAALRSHQELALAEPVTDVDGPTITRSLSLPLPGVSLILIASDENPQKRPIDGLYASVYRSLSGRHDDVLVKWTGIDRLVKTYEVLRGESARGPFVRVNSSDQIETSFIDERPIGEPGFIVIRAVDFWDRVLGESQALALPSR